MKRIKNILLAAYDFIDSYLYDIWRYWHHSQAFARFRSRVTARAYLLMTAHALEKGLALQDRRPGFGKVKCNDLMDDITLFQNQFGPDPVCLYVNEVITEVLAYHKSTNDEDPALVSKHQLLNVQPNQKPFSRHGGLCRMWKTKIAATLPSDPVHFFSSRRSVRQFAVGKIPDHVIQEAVRIAQSAPSVCNRQSCHLYYSTAPEILSKVIAHQNGAGGFGNHAGAVFIVTSELGSFNRAGERNQGYVDGGIFAATLAMGIHALGYGACMLNWSATARQDRKLRRAFAIADSQLVIALLVAGCLRDEFEVSASPRLPVEEILHRL